MNRRNFLRSMLGVAAATALPSEIWPFRKIFVPADPKPIDLTGMSYMGPDPGTWLGLDRSPYPGRLSGVQQITELELEVYGKQLSALLMRTSPLYELFKRREEAVLVNGLAFVDRNGVYTSDENGEMVKISETPMRIPLRNRPAQSIVHAPATPDNIMEFIDGVEDDLS